jgi:hypothetical protein
VGATAFSGVHERGDGLEAIAIQWHAARSGSGRLVVIEGQPGIGKTGLLRTARARLGSEVARVLAACAGELEASTTRLRAATRRSSASARADDASLVFSTFLARWIEDAPGLPVVATRPAGPKGRALLVQLVADPAARVLRPASLSRAPSRSGAGRRWRPMSIIDASSPTATRSIRRSPTRSRASSSRSRS